MSTIKVNTITPLSGTHTSGSFNGVFSGSIVNSRIDSLENFSSSLDAAFATDAQLYKLYQTTASLNTYTSSNESWKSGIRAELNSIEAWTSSLEAINAIDAELYQLYQTTASLNLYTQSLNTKTGSFATTGSNTFNGNQTINGSITLQNGAVIKDTPNYGVSFGYQAGLTNQGTQSLALGNGAGYQNQSHGTVAIGTNAGAINQGLRATALGSLAGTYNQGEYAVAIGNNAAPNNQASHSIVINATGIALENTSSNSLVIDPIRNVSGNSGVLQYNDVTKEVSYSNQFNGNQYITGSLIPDGSGSYDLGSEQHPWRDLYISTSSIKLIRDGQVVNSVSSILSEITSSNSIISKETFLIDGNLVVKDGGLRRVRITSGSVRFNVAYDETDENSEYTNHYLRAYYGTSDSDYTDRWGVGLTSTFGDIHLDTPSGNIISTGSILISGSIVPSVAEGSYTSSFSLGSSTNAWKELWVSNGSVNFVDPISGNTASIALNDNNVISVQQIESIGNLNVTGSLGVAEGISLAGERVSSESGSVGVFNITFPRAHRIYSEHNGNFVFHSHHAVHFYMTKLYDANAKLNVTGSVKIHGDRAIAGLGTNNPSDTALEVIGNSEFTGSILVSGSNSTVVLPNHSTAPTSPSSGALYFNTTDFHFYGWNGGQWKQLDN